MNGVDCFVGGSLPPGVKGCQLASAVVNRTRDFDLNSSIQSANAFEFQLGIGTGISMFAAMNRLISKKLNA